MYEGKVKLVSFSTNFKSHVLLDLIEVGFVPSPGSSQLACSLTCGEFILGTFLLEKAAFTIEFQAHLNTIFKQFDYGLSLNTQLSVNFQIFMYCGMEATKIMWILERASSPK